MAGPGRVPKPPGQTRHRPSKASEPPRRTLEATPAPPPPLPEAMGYSAATRRWYRTWATAPQASRFLATDWQRLHMLAPLVDRYWSAPEKTLMGEIRLNESLLGATTVDRLRLRWDVEAPKTAPTAHGVNDGEREAKIMRLVDGAS